jgi:hypothetical protein
MRRVAPLAILYCSILRGDRRFPQTAVVEGHSADAWRKRRDFAVNSRRRSIGPRLDPIASSLCSLLRRSPSSLQSKSQRNRSRRRSPYSLCRRDPHSHGQRSHEPRNRQPRSHDPRRRSHLRRRSHDPRRRSHLRRRSRDLLQVSSLGEAGTRFLCRKRRRSPS